MSEKRVPLASIVERKKEVSDKISTQVRTIALGILIATWGILTNANPQTEVLEKNFLPVLSLIDLSCVIALLFDFLQYVCSYQVVSKALDTFDQTTQMGDYDEKSESFKWANRFFLLKQVIVAIAVFIFIFCLALYFGLRIVVPTPSRSG